MKSCVLVPGCHNNEQSCAFPMLPHHLCPWRFGKKGNLQCASPARHMVSSLSQINVRGYVSEINFKLI